MLYTSNHLLKSTLGFFFLQDLRSSYAESIGWRKLSSDEPIQ